MHGIGLILFIAAMVLVFGFLAPTMVIAAIIFGTLLWKNRPDKWDGEACSSPEDPQAVQMDEQGEAWALRYKENQRTVSIRNDGLTLCADYFDFGFKRTAIILPGRMESRRYSWYFAEPYRAAGWNVLAPDGRAHGRSQGKFNCLGFKEYRDILAWSRYLHEGLGTKAVFLHGICIGAAGATFALTCKACPDYIVGMAAEGMYVNWYESCKNHMLADHRPIFPFLYEMLVYIRIFCGGSGVFDGPLRRMPRMTRPLLMLHSREDLYSLPQRAQDLYNACASEKKELVWFETGAHSRVRITHPQAYDTAIQTFLQKYIDEKE